MTVEIRITNKPVPVSDVPRGEFCRRVGDRVYFFKTNESELRKQPDGQLTCLCVNVADGCVHRVRSSTLVELVPRTVIDFVWTAP